MSTSWGVRITGPDVRLATQQFQSLRRRITRESTLAIKAELIRLTPVDKGNLVAGWDVTFRIRKGELEGLITNNAATKNNEFYIHWIIRGTGVYGPYNTPIKPVKKKALAFSIGGKTLIRRSVKGMKPNDFPKEAMKNAREEIENIIRREAKIWYKPGPIKPIK